MGTTLQVLGSPNSVSIISTQEQGRENCVWDCWQVIHFWRYQTTIFYRFMLTDIGTCNVDILFHVLTAMNTEYTHTKRPFLCQARNSVY